MGILLSIRRQIQELLWICGEVYPQSTQEYIIWVKEPKVIKYHDAHNTPWMLLTMKTAALQLILEAT